MIDMVLDDFLKMVPGLAGAVIAACGVVVARRALSTWQRELKGKTEFDLARRTLLAAYKVQIAMTSVRNDFAQDPIDARFARLGEARASLNVCLLEAKVIWGDALEEADRALSAVEKDVRLAVIRVQRAEKDTQYNVGLNKSGKWEQTYATASGDEDDETGKKVTAAVQVFERALRRHLPTRKDDARSK